MTEGHRAARLLVRAASRPTIVIIAWLAAAALAGVSASRIHPSSSMASMLAEDDPAARALAAVTDRFSVGDELIVVAAAPHFDDLEAARTRLLDFGEALTRAIQRDLAAAELCREVTFRRSGDMRRFLESKLLPAALYYLDDAGYSEVIGRLTRDAIDRQLERNAELLATSGPAANFIAKRLLRDPLRLYEVIVPALQQGERVPHEASVDGFLFSHGAPALMIRIVGHEPAGNTGYARHMVQTVSTIAARVNVDDLQIDYAGGYAIATAAEESIRTDMIRSIVMSALLLTAFLVLVYRHWAAALLALSPVALGIVAAFGLGSFFCTELTPVVAVIGAVLAGLGIDYCIHFLSHYNGVRAQSEDHDAALASTYRSVGPAMIAACITSVIGFAAIAQSSVRALRHFSTLGALGLACILLAGLTWLPALLRILRPISANLERPRLLNTAIPALLGTLSHRRNHWLAASTMAAALAGVIILLVPGSPARFSGDLTVLHPRPNAPLETQHRLARDFDYGGDGMFVYLEGHDETDLVSLSHRASAVLATDEARAAGIRGTFGLANLLPDPQCIATRSAAITALDRARIVQDFVSALEDSPFDPSVYEGYVGFLRRLLSGEPPPSIRDLKAESQLASLIFPRVASSAGKVSDEALVHVRLSKPLTARADRDRAIVAARAACDGLRGATITGISVVGYDTEHRIFHELASLLTVAAMLVVVWLAVYFRSVQAVVLALVPACFGLLVLSAFMQWMDLKLNAVNLIGLPLLVGIGVDDGIFLVSISRHTRRDRPDGLRAQTQFASGCHAILMTTLTTVLTFGTLVFTSTPAIQSLGVMLAIGMFSCLAGSLFLLAPILLWRSARPFAKRDALE